MGARIRYWRLRQKLTQGEIAKSMKHSNGDVFSVSYVSAVERGQIKPSLDALEQFAAVLKVPTVALLSDEYDQRLAPGESPLLTQRDDTHEANVAKLRNAQIGIYQGRFDDALALAEQVLAESRTARDLGMAQLVRAQVLDARGDLSEALTAYRQALETARQANDRDLTERARLALGDVFAKQGKPIDALSLHKTCLEAVQQGIMRDPHFVLHTYASLGHEYASLNQTSQAVEMLAAAASLGEQLSDPTALGDIYWQLSQENAARGNTGSARQYGQQAVHAFDQAERQATSAAVYAKLGLSHLSASQLSEADEDLHLAIGMARQMSDFRIIAEAALGLTELATQRNQLTEAETAMQEALHAAEIVQDDALLASVYLTQAKVFVLLNKNSEAETAINAAVMHMKRVTVASQLAGLLARLSTYYESRGDHEQAIAQLKRAWELLSHGTD